MTRNARVVIGLPVFNGENFLAEAIESILAQSYGDFRLIVSDNCSTDATEDICRRYLKLDDRIEYHRQDRNLGGAPNYNFVFRPEGADYFKWAAHDDLLEPNFLEETVPLLDAHPDAVIAHGRSLEIDETGHVKCDFDQNPVLSGASPSQRFWSILWAEYFTEVFGLMRADAISRTRLHGSYPGSDRTFMAEMLMLGNVVYSPKVIFRRRAHPNAFVHSVKTAKERQAWFDPSVRRRLPPFVTRTCQHWRAVGTVPMSNPDRWACRLNVARWAGIRAAEITWLRLHGARRTSLPLSKRMEKRRLITLEEEMSYDKPVAVQDSARNRPLKVSM
jgi:glycosyltransferase involved in cell wall biosynthesis